MNVLLALYKEGETNSGIHAASLAQALNRLGHECVIAVPGSDETHAPWVKGRYAPTILSFKQVEDKLQNQCLFMDGRSIDIFHAWTPRDVIHSFYDHMTPWGIARLVVHMEDNEDELVRHFLGEAAYLKALTNQWQGPFPSTLTHPLRGRDFIRAADGVTMLVDAMRDHLPSDIPGLVIWPAADERIYYPRPEGTTLRGALDLPPEAIVIVYTGVGHPANQTEIRSLYLAIHLLNRRGIPARLVRTGVDVFAEDEAYRSWARRYSIELGRVHERSYLGDLISMADILVQPGVPGPFNDMRFPSKLPEFFASARPVILPRTNIGLVTRHLQDAYVLEKADGPSIAAAVEDINHDPELRKTLAQGARSFYETHFSWMRSAEKMEQFYADIMGQDTTKGAGNA